MNFITKSISAAALGLLLLAAPASALAYYPYTWFTGTSYLAGPGYMVGMGGFSTGPVGIYSSGSNYYGSSNCNDYYGCGTINYNAMTGQFIQNGQQQYMPTQYGNMQYGNQYGGYNNYSNLPTGQAGYQQYIPMQAQQYMYGYGGYGGYGY